ncbi:MAG TPA: hypothetical protein PLD35_04760 [Caldisericia bacterium]|nr:hypothetical protein [Caldisericia bacterium]HPO29308.1 hypothetical protein [Caldisericia bacterium]HXK70224.1 hypothetical protein [Caldisericia bacterium]
MNCKIKSNDDLYAYYLTGGGTSDDPTSASTVLSGGLEDLTRCSILPDSGIIEQPNKNYDIKYEVDEYGNVKLSAVDKAGNPVELSPEDQAILDNINKGMNDALNWLRDQGFKFNDLAASKKEIMNFISKYSSMFYHITGGETPDNAYELAYNATVGLAIACEMKTLNDKYYHGDYDKGQYDQEIGFWTSYYSSKSGMNLSFKHGDIKGEEGLDTVLGLVEVAVMMKALMYKENGKLDPNRINKNENDTIDYGLMMLNSHWFPKTVNAGGIFAGMNFEQNLKDGKWTYDPFYNIGGGIGMVFNKFSSSNPPTLMQWFKAVNLYNPGDERFGEVVKYFHWMMGGWIPGTGEVDENPFTHMGWEDWYKIIAKNLP